jgi:hypothetical protein
MEHEQFEILVAAILTVGTTNGNGTPASVTESLVKMCAAVRESGLITKRSATFIPKGGR